MEAAIETNVKSGGSGKVLVPYTLLISLIRIRDFKGIFRTYQNSQSPAAPLK